jgi:hypothetical protein
MTSISAYASAAAVPNFLLLEVASLVAYFWPFLAGFLG